METQRWARMEHEQLTKPLELEADMAIDAIVRVSLQSNVKGNQAVNAALVGHPTYKSGSGPFKKVGTAAYSCSGAGDAAVGSAILQLGQALDTYSSVIDFVSISIVRRT